MPAGAYRTAERFLLSREFFGMKLGLENITEFLVAIGSPQLSYPTIHVAGTNGKGSTVSMLAAVLRAQGYRTGLYTSPHLVSLRERVRVDGHPIPERSVTAFVARYRRELVRRKLSFFEVLTAMAFEHFARAGVDLAVVETGLGGRLDATNVLCPLLTVTTDISRDHMEILGRTLRKIAFEKAGIVKSGVPHLIGLLPPVAEEVIARCCAELGAPLHRLRPRDFAAFGESNRLDFHENGWRISGLVPGLIGPHQLRNTALALKALAILRDQGLAIDKQAVYQGMARLEWPGRFQIVARRGRPTLVFDVGHNAGGIAAFVETFQTRFPGRKALILTGFVKRKEHQKMVDHLAKIAAQYVIVPLDTKRSVDTAHLLGTINWRRVPVHRAGSVATGWRRVARTAQPDDIIAVIGSHYLVGEFFEKIGSA